MDNLNLQSQFVSALADLEQPSTQLVERIDRVANLFLRAAALEALDMSMRRSLTNYAEQMRVLRDMLRDTQRIAVLCQSFAEVYAEVLSVGPDEVRH